MTKARRLSPEVREQEGKGPKSMPKNAEGPAETRYRNRAVYFPQRGADFTGHWEEYDGTLPDAPLHGVCG